MHNWEERTTKGKEGHSSHGLRATEAAAAAASLKNFAGKTSEIL